MIIAEEMILSYMSLKYFTLLKDFKDKNNYCFKLESYEDENDNSPLKFNLIWELLNHKIKIKIKEYMKKDVRSCLEWIFDFHRIRKKDKLSGLEDCKNCLNAVIKAYNAIIDEVRLKKLCYKYLPIKDMKVLDANNIKDIVTIVMRAQMEFSYFICNIEQVIISRLSRVFFINKLNELMEEEGYFNFNKLVEFYNNNIDKIGNDNQKLDDKIVTVRNMLLHGRLFDEDISYVELIHILDNSMQSVLKRKL